MILRLALTTTAPSAAKARRLGFFLPPAQFSWTKSHWVMRHSLFARLYALTCTWHPVIPLTFLVIIARALRYSLLLLPVTLWSQAIVRPWDSRARSAAVLRSLELLKQTPTFRGSTCRDEAPPLSSPCCWALLDVGAEDMALRWVTFCARALCAYRRRRAERLTQ